MNLPKGMPVDAGAAGGRGGAPGEEAGPGSAAQAAASTDACLQLQPPVKLIDLLFCMGGGVVGGPVGPSSEPTPPSPSAEITLLWPPCVGCQEHSVIEVQVGITRIANHHAATVAAAPLPGAPAAPPPGPLAAGLHQLSLSAGASLSNIAAAGIKDGSRGGSLMVHAVSNALPLAPSFTDPQPSKHTAHLLTVARDSVTAAEPIALVGRRVQSRVRVYERDPTVLSFVMADRKGFPSCETIKDAALLPVLPPQACHEMHGLLWSMMHESLPLGSELPPYDPEAFSSPFACLPTPLQQAASWAWGNHFRHLAADLNYCLECVPEPGSEQEHDFRAMLCSMVAYLRDHDAWAMLACLLASCAARGCVLLSAHATSPLSVDELSAEHVAAMSGSGPACTCCLGTDPPCLCATPASPASPCSPTSPTRSMAFHLMSAFASPPPSPIYHHGLPADLLPSSPMLAAGVRSPRGLHSVWGAKEAGAHVGASVPASPARHLATYLRTTCDGMGVWLAKAEQAGACSGVAVGALGRSRLGGQMLMVGTLLVMVASWLVLVLPFAASSRRVA